jgi:lysophospholipase L1-like esterase
MRALLGFAAVAALLAGLPSCQVRQSERSPSTQTETPPASRPATPSNIGSPKPSRAEPATELAASRARAPGPRRTYRVAALGDSITDERVGGGGYLKYLRRACPQSRFYDFGKGGDMTNQMLRRLQRDLLAEKSALELDTLIVLGGVNDLYSNLSAGRTNQRIEEDLVEIYQTAKQNGLRVVAVTVLPWGGFSKYFTPERSESTRALNSFILGLQSHHSVDLAVDGYALLSCGDPERLCPAFERKRPDGLHPGPEGHEVLGRTLLEQVFSDCR